MAAIHQVLHLRFPSHDNTDETHTILKKLSEEFSSCTNGNFDKCVGAIDGLIIRTRCPYKKEVQNPNGYRNRKGCYGILCLGIADLKGNFVSFSCNWTGSTHDSYAWQGTTLFDKMSEGKYDPYYIIGDEAFANTNYLLSPWSGRGIGPWKDSFNYWLSKCRQCVERAFGMLVKRFGVLQRKLICSQKNWSLVAVVAAKLHNLCCDFNIPNLPRLPEDIAEGDRLYIDLNEENENEVPTTHVDRVGNTNVRLTITEKLQRKKIYRPQFANVNSTA
jgi:hypothetical protein